MTPMKYRVIPHPVEIMQLTTETWWDVARWCDGKTVSAIPVMYVRTPLGRRSAYEGDYIIRDADGNFRPCQETKFHKFYEEVQE